MSLKQLRTPNEIQFIVISQMEGPEGFDPVPPFKSRYKPVVTEEETRNPTTHKKFYASPVQFKRSQPYIGNPFLGRIPRIASFDHSIQEELNFMEAKKLQYMRLGKYKKAEQMHKNMQRARSMSAREEIRRVESSHKEMKRSITVAHKKEMHFLKKMWGDYFQRLREREMNIVQAFQDMQKVDIQKARHKLEKRCQSVRGHSRDLKELAKKEEYYMKVGNFKELSYIRKQINNAVPLFVMQVKEDLQKREKLIAHWAELQEGKLAASHSKKYNTLVTRLEEYRKNKEKVYMREQKRLKQKYKNVLLQLEHDQKLELYQVNKEISFDCQSLF